MKEQSKARCAFAQTRRRIRVTAFIFIEASNARVYRNVIDVVESLVRSFGSFREKRNLSSVRPVINGALLHHSDCLRPTFFLFFVLSAGLIDGIMIALRMLRCRATEIGWYHRAHFDSRINPRFERTKVGTNDPSMDRSIKRAAGLRRGKARQGENALSTA